MTDQMILDREGMAVKTNATTTDLVAVIRNLDLKNVPPEKRRRAIYEALGRLVVYTCTDPRERAKDGYQQIAGAYLKQTGILL